MGAYLSHPIIEKKSSDESNDQLKCGSSSMQGWRISQEDAHNCILDFSEIVSLFGVYDGHGGKEVATYASQNLPKFIKETDSFKAGDYEAALKEAFLKFDKSLTEPDVIAVLRVLAKEKDGGEEELDEDDDENIGDLKEEAEMPLEEVIAKYAAGKVHDPRVAKWKSDIATPVSPFLRAKCSKSGNEAECSSSSASDCQVATSSASCEAVPSCSSSSNDCASSTPEPDVSSSSSGKEITRTSLAEKYANGEVKEEKAPAPDSSADVSEGEGTRTNGSVVVNGNCADEDERQVSEISSSENGPVDKKGKGKALLRQVPSPPKKKDSVSPDELFKKFVSSSPGEDSSESDSDDGNFLGQDAASSSEEEVMDGSCSAEASSTEASSSEAAKQEAEGMEVEEEEDSDDEEEEYDEDDEEDDDDEEFTMKLTDELKEALEGKRPMIDYLDDDEDTELNGGIGKGFLINALKARSPGSDSGCTAVVALVLKDKIFVANAGDSRCIVSKKGEAIDLSLDHKPEDELEMARITKAGGKVTGEGRVNGGLNLSRALGDHVYKQVAELPAEEQMISPMPDIKVFDVTPDTEFLVLACDGIWNFMSSQDVVDFVRPRLLENPENLSSICEELFDECLAPNTGGDGTGCDNMTAVIVQFRDATIDPAVGAAKRRATDSPKAEPEPEAKRPKTDSDPESTTDNLTTPDLPGPVP